MSEDSRSPEAHSLRHSAGSDAERPQPSASALAVPVFGLTESLDSDSESAVEELVLMLLLESLREANPGREITTAELMALYEAVIQGEDCHNRLHLQEREKEEWEENSSE